MSLPFKILPGPELSAFWYLKNPDDQFYTSKTDDKTRYYEAHIEATKIFEQNKQTKMIQDKIKRNLAEAKLKRKRK